MKVEDIRKAAKILFEAHKEKRRIELLPSECKPINNDEGYAIQAELVRMMQIPVVGWKVGATSQGVQLLLQTDRPFSGCVMNDRMQDSPAMIPISTAQRIMVEAEYVFEMHGIRANSAVISEEEVISHIKSVRLAIEVCESRFVDMTLIEAPSLIADNAVASHLILGPTLSRWSRDDLRTRDVTMSINGIEKSKGTGSSVMSDPLNALCWVINDRSSRGEYPMENFIIATGSCTGLIPAVAGTKIVAHFDGFGYVQLCI